MAGDPSSEPETTLYEAAGGMPFFVSLVDAFYEGDHWLLHMAAAVERVTQPGPIRDALMGYFVPAAEHLRNDTGLPISSARPA